MATRAANKRLAREYAAIQANPPPYITAHPSESNILEWHYILTGPPGTPYEGGQYWGTLIFPPDYPFAPPAIRMHTPSGRFQPSTRLCLSISDFHPKSFNPAWEVSTILIGLMSFMTSEEMTTGSISAGDAERKGFCARTRWWNSTGGGSTSRKIDGVPSVGNAKNASSSIKAGDGGEKFRAEWPELDEENWKWMKENRIDPTTGLRVMESGEGSAGATARCEPGAAAALRRRPGRTGSGLAGMAQAGREGRQEGMSWVRRHKWGIAAFTVFTYVLISRLLGEGGHGTATP
ncbi:MAG: Ubiquitin-conjugating enzyme E2 6 [Bogoriella megaspora]|nr:MAG: Ubiquitin-conjugating enzyme E2 6 [Bogoriella megaspora]